MPIFPGRFAADTDEPFVVFLIGVHINKPLAVRHWFPTAQAIFPMIRELQRHPHKGLMYSKLFAAPPRTALILQYWRSFEDLEDFARNPDDMHLPAWQRFNRVVGKSDTVGVYHETYVVEPGRYEAVYVNMPRFGLAEAVNHVPATGRKRSARTRMEDMPDAPNMPDTPDGVKETV